MTTQTGGPAFPTTDPNYEQKYAGEGMTMRDYFAAKAMQALIGGYVARDLQIEPGKDSARAYGIADAMLKEREK